MKRIVLGCAFVLLAASTGLRAQAPLPVIEDVEWASFRKEIGFTS
jgi:hypothetical protein